MKITTFNPLIITKDPESTIALFEELGFEKKHAPVTDTGTQNVLSFRMKHPEGYHVDVADVKNIERDMTYIRMNVDNFAEAYDIFMAHGFTNTRGDNTLDTKSSKEATLVSPSGFRLALVQHIKDHD